MYNIFYIVHIIGVVIWIGSFITLGVVLRALTKVDLPKESRKALISRIQGWVTYGIIPSAIFVLISGLYMIMQFERSGLPFYFSFMEQAGSLIILLTVIFVTLISSKLTKKVKGTPLKKEQTLQVSTKRYANYLLTSAVLGTVVIIVVGLRIV